VAQGVLRAAIASMLGLLGSAVLAPMLGPAFAEAMGTGVQAALSPAGQTVAPGADFYIDIAITQPSQQYSGWDGSLTYDPSLLTYIPEASSNQQGCLMTGTCSSACGSTMLHISPGPDTLYILDVVTCQQSFITQAGQLFHLHFRASSQPGQTAMHFKSLRFWDGISQMGPVTCAPAQIGIGMAAAAVEPATASGLSVNPVTNPVRGAATFSVDATFSGEQVIAVHDVSGRLVRTVSRSWQPAGTRQLVWDGLGDSGARVPPGMYLVSLRVGSHQSASRITLLD